MENRPKSKSSAAVMRTIDLKPGFGEMIKPAELIDIDGAAGLTLSARASTTSLSPMPLARTWARKGRNGRSS